MNEIRSKEQMYPVSIVISGPVSSRKSRGIDFAGINNFFQDFKQFNKRNEIIISTYDKETHLINTAYIHKIIINNDPGPDLYRNGTWGITNKGKGFQTNISRMLETTISGLKQASNKYVIKTRIELIPLDFLKFQAWVDPLIQQIERSKLPQIGFLKEHYTGLKISVDGTLGGIPDTFQIAEKTVLLKTWTKSQVTWTSHYNTLTKRSISAPITPEQLLGLSFFSIYTNLNLDSKIKKLRRNFFTIQLVKSIMYSEKNLFHLIPYQISHLSQNYFKGTAHIKFIEFNSSSEWSNVFMRIILVIYKKNKHFLRRAKQNFKFN